MLRRIDAFIDFEFIREKVKDLYCVDNGRPATDPVVLFKLLFIGYLYGIRSERQLVKDVQVNVAYRWFLGFSLTDKIPDASTISQNRRRRFVGTPIYQEIFDNIVEQAQKAGMVSGRVLYTDSTHLKASANKNKFDVEEVEVEPQSYLEAIDAAVEEDRKTHGKKPLTAKDEKPKSKTTKVSRTDKDAGYMVRDGKPKGFFYLDHRSVDGAYGIITDTYATPGNVHDSRPYLDRLDRQRERFGFDVDAVGPAGRKIYERRKQTVERSFADGKQLHGHRYARLRGLDKVQEQCLLSAACQNMKKIAIHKTRRALLALIDWLKAASATNDAPYPQHSSFAELYTG